MKPDRLLSDYLPPFLQEFHETKQIMNAEQSEVDGLWDSCENTLDDMFISYATENGVKRWEKIVGITPKDTDTLDERKFRILTKMNQELPYTITKLKESLTVLCGEGGFEIDLQPSNYYIKVKLALANENNYQDVVDLLMKVIPANLIQAVRIMYNGHKILGKSTHAELTAYTHEILRNEVEE